METPKLTISNKTINSLGCIIIPFLITDIEHESLFNYLSKYILIPDTYISLLKNIQDNIINNNLAMASFTIDNNLKNAKTFKNVTIKNISGGNLNIHNNNNNTKTKTKIKSRTTLKKKIILERKSKKQSEKQSERKSKSNLNTNTINQIYIIPINNKSYNKDNNDEILELARVSGNAIFNILKKNQIANVNIINTIDASSFIEALMEGLLLSSYQFLKYKTSQALSKDKDDFKLNKVNIILSKQNNISNTIIHKLKSLLNQIKSVFLARDLINEPANEAKGSLFINIIEKYIKDNNLPVSIKIFNKDELVKLGMGLILGVGNGSSVENSPRVLILKYNGGKGGEKEVGKSIPDYVLLGKGITYDTGGLDIKGSKAMLEMKTDLSGAATVISFLLGYAMNKGKKTIYSMCPLVENSVGSKSTKPSDVLTAYNGRTVEVSNTDAEGRLVLADCLAYVVDKYPNATIIDFATLTGQQESLSCKMFSNVLSVNSPKEVARLIQKGKEINEQLVELPIMEKHLKNLESYVADIKNVSFTCSADIIMSALFMRQFVKKNTKWIHIDIAGPSYKANEIIKYASPEASGIGVRLLFAYFE